MDLDREKERRVWERVRGGKTMPPLKGDSVGHLEKLVRENGEVLFRLSRQANGKQGEKLRRLSQDQNRLALAVRGIGYLRGESGSPSPASGGKENPRRMLAMCMQRCMEFCRECRDRGADPDHGPLFLHLARQASEQAVGMAEVLGELEK
jgi:hypothetical protein